MALRWSFSLVFALGMNMLLPSATPLAIVGFLRQRNKTLQLTSVESWE